MSCGFPRLIVAGAGGDSGKTLVSLGLVAAWREAGLSVAAFKKGPDFIDAAWLSVAAESPARNLDVWLMGREGVRQVFVRHAAGADISVVEGNRGFLDGFEGCSTAALAETLRAPVILVVDVTKVTRTTAALVAGCRVLAPEVVLAGVVLNRVAGPRHEAETTRAIEECTGVPVLGSIPKLPRDSLLPDRHLGLVPPTEFQRRRDVIRRLARLVRERLRLDAVIASAWSLGTGPMDGSERAAHGNGADTRASVPNMTSGDALEDDCGSAASGKVLREVSGEVRRPASGRKVTIGVFNDSAFSFYYPENLEGLETAGAELVMVSPLYDKVLPPCDLLYFGGGFPETHSEVLGANRGMIEAVRSAVQSGMPVYAECGGLIYLARSVTYRGRCEQLCGVLDVNIVVESRPQGHGYSEMLIDRENPFFPVGTLLRGHEHHHSRLEAPPHDCAMVMKVNRGKGSADGRDGLVTGNVMATWLHVHAEGAIQWAPALVRCARAHARDNGGLRVGS